MDALSQLIKALSEEIRLRIVALLGGGELCVCDLMAVLDLPQSTISRHLAYLKNAGLVEGERRGVWMYYRLSERRGFRQEVLLKALDNLFPAEDRTRDDLQKLESYLKTKKGNSCK
ncbi:MAG: metalloregulator ArsR/SmtB family transcription factor [Deltaproteobacteria bacterium]